jgi:hypothetical protein
MDKPNLGSVINSRDNNLNIIRLLAIIMVLQAHSFVLSGHTAPLAPFFLTYISYLPFSYL